ncbi:MAG TPA: NnrS family protein [Chthoniobacterales bacterium]|nr:NnrS family protein [Chthoniobacterales bacterium]
MEAPPSNVERRRTGSPAQICQEPFRIFFPVGALLGLVGVSLWALYYLGAGVPYPNVTHARLMIEGLMASFIFGFLGTAGPRLTSAPHFSRPEIAIVFTFDLFAAGAHTGGAHRLGDICFVLCLSLFARMLLRRFRQRKDNPPPNFILVALGILSGILGASLVAYSEEAQYSRLYQAGSALLNECFVLLPILGVAPFFIGRLLDLPGSDLPESRAFSREWKRQGAFNAVIGVAITASFVIETAGPSRAACWIRVAAIAFYLAARMPWRGHTFLADYLRAGLLFILAGFTLIALWPNYRIGSLHTVFVSGFNLIVFTVATRVVLGHSGNLDRLKTRLWFFIFMSALLFLAMVSRVTADLSPRARIIHLLAAAFCWLVAALIWIIKVIPKVTVTEGE